jgi:hypothetical protein
MFPVVLSINRFPFTLIMLAPRVNVTESVPAKGKLSEPFSVQVSVKSFVEAPLKFKFGTEVHPLLVKVTVPRVLSHDSVPPPKIVIVGERTKAAGNPPGVDGGKKVRT